MNYVFILVSVISGLKKKKLKFQVLLFLLSADFFLFQKTEMYIADFTELLL